MKKFVKAVGIYRNGCKNWRLLICVDGSNSFEVNLNRLQFYTNEEKQNCIRSRKISTSSLCPYFSLVHECLLLHLRCSESTPSKFTTLCFHFFHWYTHLIIYTKVIIKDRSNRKSYIILENISRLF